MGVRPGYKRTQVGVIPEEWGVDALGKSCDVVTKGTTPTSIGRSFTRGGVAFLKAESISESGKTIPEKVAYIDTITHALMKRSQLKRDDVLISIAGVLGRVGFVEESDLPANTNQALAIVRLGRKSEFERHFLFYALRSPYVSRQIRDINVRAAQANISLQDVRGFVLPMPSVAEQCAIATALSDVDALLAGLDRLIAKKRDLKQAAMQQLLTGQTRLAGFAGDWKQLDMARNSRLNARIGWQGLTSAEYLANGTHYLVTGTDFSSGRVNWATCPFVGADRYEQDRNIQLRRDDVLVTKDGTIGKVAFVNELFGPATLNSGVFVIRPKDSAYESKFLYHILSSGVFDDFLKKLAAGSTISHLYQKDFVSFAFLAPPTLAEQSAIAEALDDMDSELAALEVRRNKTRDLKQAMMQELLTGNTRLVHTENVNV